MVGPTVLTNDSACMSSQPAQADAWHTAGLLLSHGTHRHSAGSPPIRIPALMVRAPYSYRYSVLQRLFLGAVPWISNELVADWLLNLCPAQTTGVVMTYELA